MSKDNTTVVFTQLLENQLNADFFLNSTTSAFVQIFRGGKREVHRIDKATTPNFIRGIFRDFDLGKCSRHTIENIVDDLLSLAFNSKKIHQVFVRSGRHSNGTVEIDLGNGDFAKIYPGGWDIRSESDLSFWRPATFKELPRPERVSLDEFLALFRKHLNLVAPEEYLLILPALLKVLVPNSGDNPIVILSGGQGTGKSTLANFLKSISDPTDNNVLFAPKSINDIIASSQNTRFLVFDNLSYINQEMSDALCVICTGGSFTKRALFTDDVQKIYKLENNLMLTGIGEIATRPDLLDRAVIIAMAPIPFREVRAQSDLEAQLAEDYPKLVGGLFELAAKVLEVLPSVQTMGLPRMTEYSRFGIAIEKVLGLKEGSFLNTYTGNIIERSEVSFEQDAVCLAIADYVRVCGQPNIIGLEEEEKREKEYVGTVGELYYALMRKKKYSLKGINSLQHFSKHFERIKPLLDKNGIGFEQLPRRKNKRMIRLWIKKESEEYKDL